MCFNHTPVASRQGTGCKGGFERLSIRLIVTPTLFPSCDFHLFPSLKGHLRGKHFKEDNQLKTENILSGIENLRERYSKCMPVHGNYVEK